MEYLFNAIRSSPLEVQGKKRSRFRPSAAHFNGALPDIPDSPSLFLVVTF